MENAVRFMQRFALVLAVLLTACASGTDEAPSGSSSTAQPLADAAAAPAPQAGAQAGEAIYQFDAPDASFALADELREISGLTVLSDGRLAAVQDEEGTVFILNPTTGAVEARTPFGEAGDYEGIELVGDRLFVLVSKGDLYELSGWDGGAPEVRLHETHLRGKNDTEGLGYDAANNRLLIACKEDAGEGLDKDKRAVYAFDLASGRLSDAPVFVLDAKALEDQIQSKGKFRPSGLAVHPATGDVYIVSSVAKAIVVVGGDGQVRRVWDLPEDIFEQPEGLAFLPNGDLFVSSEGADGPGMLYRFTPRGS